MNIKEILVGAVVAVVIVVGGYFVGVHSVVQTGGDFSGGIVPTQLFSANAAGGYVAPVGSLAVAMPNGSYVGGTSLYNQQTSYVSASGTLPSAGFTLGPLNSVTSTATTTFTIWNTGGLAVGSICSGSTATTTAYVGGCMLVSTNGVTGTVQAAISNMTGSNAALPSSTRVNVTFDQLPY